MQETFARLDPAVAAAAADALARAGRVAVIAGDAARGVALDFTIQLGMVRGGVEVADVGSIALSRSLAWLGRDDVLVAIDTARYERSVATAVERAAADGARVLAVSDSHVSPIARVATWSFQVVDTGAGPFDSFVAALALTNLLVSLTARRLGRKAVRHIDRLDADWDATGVAPPRLTPATDTEFARSTARKRRSARRFGLRNVRTGLPYDWYNRAVHDPTRHPPVPTLPDVERAATTLAAGVPSGAVLVRGLDVGRSRARRRRRCDPADAGTRVGDVAARAPPPGSATRSGTCRSTAAQVVQNIYPLAESVGQQISTSSDVSLAFHTETAFHPHKSHYLLLLCLRGDPGAAHHAVQRRRARPAARRRRRARPCGEPRFRTGVDLSFGRGDGWMTAPGPGARPRATTARGPSPTTASSPSASTHGARDALARARRRDRVARYTSVVLDAGDLLVVDNRRAVHGRSEFRARFDGTDRWLQRTFVVDDLASIADRRGSVITTQFSAAA